MTTDLFDQKTNIVDQGATFSPCRRYRYVLWRRWDVVLPSVALIGLNPSIADEGRDDPTIRRETAFARAWGFGGLIKLNLFALIATDPRAMLEAADPIGTDGDQHLIEQTRLAPMTVAAWGVHGRHRGRADQVRVLLPELHYLRLNKGGSPAHPLYLPKTLKPQWWPK